MTTWRCPRCGHTTTQPARVTNVSHWCPATRHHDLTPLERDDNEGDDSDE